MKTKKIVIASCIILLAIAGIFLIINKTPSQIQNRAMEQNILDVDKIAVDTTAYTGKLTVRGAVSFVYPEQSTFVIIDLNEYDKCGVVTCAIHHLAVSYSKQLPKAKDRVEITGELVRTTQGYILKAENVIIK